jgi:GT2 family glycosyltransferase
VDSKCSVIIPVYNRKNEVIRCIDSILKSTYKYLEFVIVDNASTDGTLDLLNKYYHDNKNFKIIGLPKNTGAVGGRNEGIKYAKGKFLVFVDSDNVVDKNCIKELVNTAKSDERIGFVGPKMYYYKDKKRVWYAGAKINLTTSKTSYIGINQIDTGQFDRIKKVEHIPNLWLVKKEVIDKIGGLDQRYVMTYGESDWPMRAKQAGFKIIFCPRAITYHDIPSPSKSKSIRARLGFDTKYRIYYMARNRTLFMRRFSKPLNFIVYLLIFMPMINLVYLLNLLRFKKYHLITSLFKGIIDGIANINLMGRK